MYTDYKLTTVYTKEKYKEEVIHTEHWKEATQTAMITKSTDDLKGLTLTKLDRDESG